MLFQTCTSPFLSFPVTSKLALSISAHGSPGPKDRNNYVSPKPSMSQAFPCSGLVIPSPHTRASPLAFSVTNKPSSSLVIPSDLAAPSRTPCNTRTGKRARAALLRLINATRIRDLTPRKRILLGVSEKLHRSVTLFKSKFERANSMRLTHLMIQWLFWESTAVTCPLRLSPCSKHKCDAQGGL